MADEWKTLLKKSMGDIDKAFDSSGLDRARGEAQLRANLEDVKYRRSPEYVKHLGRISAAQSAPGYAADQELDKKKHEYTMAEIAARNDPARKLKELNEKMAAGKTRFAITPTQLRTLDFMFPDEEHRAIAAEYASEHGTNPSVEWVKREHAKRNPGILTRIGNAMGFGSTPEQAQSTAAREDQFARPILESALQVGGRALENAGEMVAGIVGPVASEVGGTISDAYQAHQKGNLGEYASGFFGLDDPEQAAKEQLYATGEGLTNFGKGVAEGSQRGLLDIAKAGAEFVGGFAGSEGRGFYDRLAMGFEQASDLVAKGDPDAGRLAAEMFAEDDEGAFMDAYSKAAGYFLGSEEAGEEYVANALALKGDPLWAVFDLVSLYQMAGIYRGLRNTGRPAAPAGIPDLPEPGVMDPGSARLGPAPPGAEAAGRDLAQMLEYSRRAPDGNDPSVPDIEYRTPEVTWDDALGPRAPIAGGDPQDFLEARLAPDIYGKLQDMQKRMSPEEFSDLRSRAITAQDPEMPVLEAIEAGKDKGRIWQGSALENEVFSRLDKRLADMPGEKAADAGPLPEMPGPGGKPPKRRAKASLDRALHRLEGKQGRPFEVEAGAYQLSGRRQVPDPAADDTIRLAGEPIRLGLFTETELQEMRHDRSPGRVSSLLQEKVDPNADTATYASDAETATYAGFPDAQALRMLGDDKVKDMTAGAFGGLVREAAEDVPTAIKKALELAGAEDAPPKEKFRLPGLYMVHHVGDLLDKTPLAGAAREIGDYARLEHQAATEAVKNFRHVWGEVLSDADDLRMREVYRKWANAKDEANRRGIPLDERAGFLGELSSLDGGDKLKRAFLEFEPTLRKLGGIMEGTGEFSQSSKNLRNLYIPESPRGAEVPIPGVDVPGRRRPAAHILTKRILPQRRSGKPMPLKYYIESAVRESTKHGRGGSAARVEALIEKIHAANDLDTNTKDAVLPILESYVGKVRRSPGSGSWTYNTAKAWESKTAAGRKRVALIEKLKGIYEDELRKYNELIDGNENLLREIEQKGFAVGGEAREFREKLSATRGRVDTAAEGLTEAADGTAFSFLYDIFGRDPAETVVANGIGAFVTNVLGMQHVRHAFMNTVDFTSFAPMMTSPSTAVSAIIKSAPVMAKTAFSTVREILGADRSVGPSYESLDLLSSKLRGDDVHLPGTGYFQDIYEAIGDTFESPDMPKMPRRPSSTSRLMAAAGGGMRNLRKAMLWGLEGAEHTLTRASTMAGDIHFRELWKKHGGAGANVNELVKELLGPIGAKRKGLVDYMTRLGTAPGGASPDRRRIAHNALRNAYVKWLNEQIFVGRGIWDQAVSKAYFDARAGKGGGLMKALTAKAFLFTRHPAKRWTQFMELSDIENMKPDKAAKMMWGLGWGFALSWALLKAGNPDVDDGEVAWQSVKWGLLGDPAEKALEGLGVMGLIEGKPAYRRAPRPSDAVKFVPGVSEAESLGRGIGKLSEGKGFLNWIKR